MKILHLLSSGGLGGIETLCLEIAKKSKEINDFCFLMEGGIIADEIEKTGCVVYRLYQDPHYKLRIFRILELLRNQKYDIFIEHHGGLRVLTYYLLVSYLCPNLITVKYLHAAFEIKYYYYGSWISNLLMKWVMQNILIKSDRIIAVSNYVKESFTKYFKCDENKIQLVYNGISQDYYLDAGNKQINHMELLYIGRLVEEKGVKLLVSAVEKLKREGVQFHLTLVGEGKEREVCEDMVTALGLDSNISFAGGQLNKKKYLEFAHIFVYPSTCQEAFGISILEAMAAGLICVASSVGGIPEIIDDKYDGFLVKDITVEQLYYTLRKAIIDYNNYSNFMIMRAKNKAKKFTIEQTLNSLSNICYELYNKK